MSLIQDCADIEASIRQLSIKANGQQLLYYALIKQMVKLQQKYRLEKNYEVSDAIREVLNSVGVEIIQGTAQYKYEDIPAAMKNRTVEDTWRIKESPRTSQDSS